MSGAQRVEVPVGVAMRKGAPPSFAMNDPAIALTAIFRPLPKRAPGERPKLDLEQTFGGAIIRWRGPDTLSIPDQSVWLSLVAFAALEKAKLPREADCGASARLLSDLQLRGWAVDANAALVICSWSELARACGMSATGGRSLNQLKDAVRRLAEVTVWCDQNGVTTSTRLLAWVIGDDEQVHVALNWRIARILFESTQYARVCLEERRRLNSDVAKALHAWLSAALRPGRENRYALDTLAARVFGDAGAGAKARDRRRRVRGALQELNGLAGWAVIESGQVVTISRAPRENAHASRENAHAPPVPTHCPASAFTVSQTPLLRGSTNRVVEGKPSEGSLRRLQAPPASLPRSPRMGGDEHRPPR